MVASEIIRARPPTTLVVWVHQIHTAGGVSGSTTMVMVFARLFVFFVWSCNSWLLSQGHYMSKMYNNITLRWGLWCYFLPHIGLHHTGRGCWGSPVKQHQSIVILSGGCAKVCSLQQTPPRWLLIHYIGIDLRMGDGCPLVARTVLDIINDCQHENSASTMYFYLMEVNCVWQGRPAPSFSN